MSTRGGMRKPHVFRVGQGVWLVTQVIGEKARLTVKKTWREAVDAALQMTEAVAS